ncbi:putative peptide maturation dehydrogenase [Stenotrophomonas sp. YAU14D1_LEIMI4_1]|uniref:putative peptide maturation dehydrogenase n=1 Tax=Stenotrophomonas sp. YAU14D1_LEIMI4_1 TaxID=2072407 RepID=UPI000D54241A|nr:putative peptide maturation dehydrogenase [Stenotrophomonas sp. YAU14D1_LEIMI4_1]AWH23813.1 putative peptide maturation dehydrogenase [Stenotrophomonas sp. YAU14D1_LEIMI4_1]
MQIRRCAIVMMEPRETTTFHFEDLIRGGDGLRRSRAWFALAPHLPEPVEISRAQQHWLGQLSPNAWQSVDDDSEDASVARELVQAGLAFLQDQPENAVGRADEALRATYWHPLAAVMHAFSRWDGVDAVSNMRESRTETAVQMRQTLGAPPSTTISRCLTGAIRLPRAEPDAFDGLLARRTTCRNFDAGRLLPLQTLSRMLQRVFGSTGEQRVSDDLVFLKKNVPSGGGLHPVEAYLIVQNVEGLPPGLYHYRGDTHHLEPIATDITVDRQFVMGVLGQQHWFADAHVLIALAPRFDRTFWKYRQHAKSYRVVALEAGHLSQTLYLAATDAGLGAFITAAINEKAIERAFSLDPMREGVLAVCGFGWRASTMETTELDPAGHIWKGAPEAD